MIFMGPSKELQPKDIDILHKYIAQGGYVVLMGESDGDARYA